MSGRASGGMDTADIFSQGSRPAEVRNTRRRAAGSDGHRHGCDRLVSHATIRAAVLLALRTVLAEAGHRVGEDFNGLELVVTS